VGDAHPLSAVEPTAEKDRVSYRRGPVTEWYVNRASGLEQGFEIAEPELRRNEPITLSMAVEGSLEPRADEAGGASFRDRAGRTRVRYAGLAAWDADGRTLGSRFEMSGGELRVLVEAGEAHFPVTVDPTFVQETRLQGRGDPLGTPGAHAGWSVSVSGDTAVLGAPGSLYGDATDDLDTDAAYVFVRSGGVWTEQQKLVASDPSGAGFFGGSVSISGDTVVVGANGVGAGSAYVFVRSGTLWSQQQKLTASDGAANDSFGYSVSIAGDTVVVGAPQDDTGGSADTGSAYVFVRSGTVWSQEQKLVALDVSDYLGASVSISGDTVILGTYYEDAPGGQNAGAAYVFVRSGTVWTQEQELFAPDGAAFDWFGYSVAVSGDTAAVGANNDATPGGGAGAGSVYVFLRSGSLWSLQQKLEASDGGADDVFGQSVSIFGDTLVVGAYYDDTTGGENAGSAYVFVRSGTVWAEQQKLLASDAAAFDSFGGSVAVSGDLAVVGAIFDDTVGGEDAGSAHVYVRSGANWIEQQELITSGLEAANDSFGWSVAISGDTALVGAPQDDMTGATDRGSAYVFVRSGTLWTEEQRLVASDGAAGDFFGWSVALSADTAVVGAPGCDTAGGSDAGSAYVFVRPGTEWVEQQKLQASDGAASDGFGGSVAVSGDTALVGAASDAAQTGAAYAFVRSGTAWSQQQKLLASDAATGDLFGASVAISGDTALVGASLDDTGAGVDAGAAYVFVRSGTLWGEEQKLMASDAATHDNFGVSVAISPDTALIGAPSDDTAGGAGSAYVFVRSGAVWNEEQKLVASDGAANDDFGWSVSLSGDVAVVGAPGGDTTGGGNTGSAYVFSRTGTRWSQEQELAASDAAPNDAFGFSVSASGDTAVVGASLDDTAGGTNAGSAYVFRAPSADLSVTKTDGVPSAIPGGSLTYTITVSNPGPYPVVGASVADTFPAPLTCTTTCSPTGGASCTAGPFPGNINDSPSIPLGQSLTYVSACSVSSSATGTLTNVASVSVPPDVVDPNPTNNSASDTDVLTPRADLRVTKTDGQPHATPGGGVTYTIVASNPGPSDAPGATVLDTFPGSITGVTWTCTPSGNAGCGGGGGSGNINRLVTLPAGGAVTFVASGTVGDGATGTLVNTALVTPPAGVTDPETSDDSATDVDNLTLLGLSDLVHGVARVRSLESSGPGPPSNLFRIRQEPRSSYEVVVDAVTGDIASASGDGPSLQRLAADATTVLQTATAAGAGASRSLRFENTSAVAREDEFVRVESAGCTTTCGPEDVYRIRAWDTTLRCPRFNNNGTQITVLLLQNTTGTTVSGHAHFWNAAGALAADQPFSLGPEATYVVNTSALTGAAGLGGTVTVSHDGPYGAMTGKAVGVEPATGLAFDTPLEPRKP
jgi:uncharacterized repeat protein (TIGR01451 family)